MENIETLLAAVAQTQGFEDDEPVVSTGPALRLEKSVSSPEIRGMWVDARPCAVVNRPPETAVPALGQVIGAVEKRKRGRPPKGQLAAKPPPPKRKKQEDEEEDVCFICFDGGSLVLCDRKGCPKAYHPACIKRDEAFFKSKAKWNCGWHICSVCRKASHYMCYTCTYSLCKGCTKDADYLCVRGNKGFCTTCMKTIMLIENKDQANNDSAVQVDFDDKTSWEYLFKVYWVLLKEKLSLTMSELTQARKPWKGVAPVVRKPQLSHTALDGKVSNPNRSSEHLEMNKLREAQNYRLKTATSSIDNHIEKLNSDKGEDVPIFSKDTKNDSTDESSIEGTGEPGIKKATDKPVIEKDEDNPSIVKDTGEPRGRDPENPGIGNHTEWASKALLEFVVHMKNGDISALSQFDVQSLLLDYIKTHNLGDPIQKSQIICDSRLKNLFGKQRVDHIEMLKLLESHFLIKEDYQKVSFIPAGFFGSVASDMEVDGNNLDQLMRINSRKRKTCKKSEERAPQNNLSEYAAIDVHNINLIYLRRNLMENLIEDKENFHDKVVGSIVRIRISSNDQKPDVYRLVQVVGTSKVAEPYKIGDRTANILLEVLNLDMKEVVSIDAISNQEFTEDECRQLYQSIRCGLLKQFTLDEIRKKAMALQPVRLNDWLEAEILRLNHLRDQASEKGRKKEYPLEYVHKIQLLKSPEEHQRRISEVPEIHADPEMSPNYESEDARSGDNSKRVRIISDADHIVQMNMSGRGESEGSIQAQNRMIDKIDASGSDSLEKHMNQVNITNSGIGGGNDQVMLRSELETSTATVSVANSLTANNIETEKLWHYRDPNGKIQGPFSMIHLRQWSTTGLFPPDMRIWTNHEQYDSLLLTDALNGKFHGASELPHNLSSESQEHRDTGGIGRSKAINRNDGDSKQTEAAWCNRASVLSDNNSGSMRPDQSSWPQCWDFLKNNSSSADYVPARSSLPSSSLGHMSVALPDRVRERDGFNHSPQNTEENSSGPTQNETTSGHELQNKSTYQSQAGQSSEESLRPLPIDLSLNDIESGSVFAPVSKSPDSIKQDADMDVSNLRSPTLKTRTKHWGVQTAGKQHSVPSNVHTQNSGILELLSPPRSNNEDQEGQVTETKQSGLTNFPVPNSGPSWSSASNLVVGSVQLPEVADDWCGYSPTPVKPSVQEWDSGLVSASSLKPPEVTSENVATSDSNQLTHVSPSHPASNIPNWLAIINEPIEFDSLGEESVSDLLAEVDAMESQGALPSPTSAMKFAKELIQDCKDDCFSSIGEFSPTPDPGKSDALSSTGEIQLSCQSSVPCKPVGASPIDALDSFSKSGVHSSGSSAGETNAPVYPGEACSEFHRPAPNNMSQDMVGATMAPGMGSETMDPGWGTVQGNINLVTVQGNVNLVLGGPAQGMANLGWGTNPGTAWGNPNINQSPINGSLQWDGQRKYGGERFTSPREWGYQGGDPGFGRGRPPWGRPPYGGGGGYSRPLPKGQRVCKFYESGRCKKGAFCDYLHP
ncbi:hypothetical protein Pfo_018623 [Paulownia fortunei]|nr:hypothetical protein Pfo_018623 [Paulownia fortunei]